MRSKVRIAIATALALGAMGALSALAPSALAQKGVVGGGAGVDGVTSLGGDMRYTTFDGHRVTTVAGIETDGGEIASVGRVPGRWAIPEVANDGSPAGLSGDGRTLVLHEPGYRFPQRESEFVVLDTRRLKPVQRITLDGTFTFDALSPDGERMYLIEYVDPRDINAYQVRAYDLPRERLEREPIIDPDEAPVTMGGQPATRATSADGRWAYTLYDSLDRERPPFIHALDTETGTAACIDLEGGLVQPRRVFRMKLEPSADGSTLAVVDRGTTVAIVDTQTFEVTEPAVEADDSAADTRGGGLGWAVAAVALGTTGVVVAAVVRRRRRARTVRTDELERLFQADEKPGPTEDQTRPRDETRADERARDPAGAP